MNGTTPTTRPVALAGVLGACLSLFQAAPAAAAPRPITGSLDRPGLTVVALAPHGNVRAVVAKPRFRLVPPSRSVTLQLRDRRGRYLGPVVVAGRDGRVTLGVRAGAKLGRIEVLAGYARVARRPSPKRLDRRRTARARHGVPVGAASAGWVRGRARGPRAPGLDPDRDGIPSKFDVDDDGDLVLDAREARSGGRAGAPALVPAAVTLRACPAAVCSGTITGDVSAGDEADVALIVAIAAATLSAISLLWQLLASRRRGRRRVEVDVRLGLPIYQQGGGDWAVFIEVLNGTDHPVRWVSAAVELDDGRRLYLMQHPAGGALPAVLQPHDSHQTWASVRELEHGGLDLGEPLTATAKLDTGEILRSPRRRLVARPLAKRLRS